MSEKTEYDHTLYDKIGIELKVNDRVCYTNGGQGHTSLEFGYILEITPRTGNHTWESPRAIIKGDNGRKQGNGRRSKDLLSLSPFKKTNPELFI